MGVVEFGERVLAWAYLSRVTGASSAGLAALAAVEGPVAAAEAVRAGRIPDVVLSGDLVDRARRDVELVSALGGRLLTPDDAQWPCERFAAAAAVGLAPLTLWVLGSAAAVGDGVRSVAMTGTRAASGYGEHVATEWARDAATAGMVTVSGGGFGIDGAVHRGSMSVGGRTVAVLACGVDRAYPAGHTRLLRQIVDDGGAVVSAFAPEVVPSRARFHARRAVVAALSDAAVVVEAGQRSGSLDVLRHARAIGRPAFAVPGPVTAPSCTGSNLALRDLAGPALRFADVAAAVAADPVPA